MGSASESMLRNGVRSACCFWFSSMLVGSDVDAIQLHQVKESVPCNATHGGDFLYGFPLVAFIGSAGTLTTKTLSQFLPTRAQFLPRSAVDVPGIVSQIIS